MKRWRRTVAALLLFLGLILALAVPAFAQSPSGLARQQLGHLPTAPMQQMLQQINQESQGYLPPLNLSQTLEGMLGGHPVTSLQTLGDGLLRYFFREVLVSGGLLAKLVILAVLAAILSHLGAAFEREEVAKMAHLVVYMALLALGLSSFTVALNLARGTMQELSRFMEAVSPLLIILLAGMGDVSSSAMLRPILLVSINTVSFLVTDVVLPLLYLAAVVQVVGQATGYKLGNLAGLLKQAGVVLLGLFMTLFIGVVTIYRLTAPVTDSLFLRTGKFLAGSFIPVVGKVFSDAADLVLGSSLVLKNAVGVVGLLGVLVVVVFPVLKLLSLIFVYRLSGALMAPVGAGPIVDSLSSLGGSLSLILAALLAVALMFFLALTMVLSIGAQVLG